MIWLACIIPVITAGILYFFYEHKVTTKEFFIPFVASILFIVISYGVSVHISTTDTEYLTYYITQTRYYEDWNERVSCRHPKYCTRTRSYSCGDSKSRRTCTGTERYQCGYQHSYDVDYHPEEWSVIDNAKNEKSVSQSWFQSHSTLWNNKKFVDLHRNYHTNDGDMYTSDWDGREETMETRSDSHSYTNKVAATNNTFTFEVVTEQERKNEGLFEYPNFVRQPGTSIYDLTYLLGYNDPNAEKALKLLNAKVGLSKQATIFIHVFKNKSVRSSILQEAYWKGGNKNEINITLGIDESNAIQWVRVFSWTEVEKVKVELKDLFESSKTVSTLPETIKKAEPIITESYKRKSFSDFDYINVQPSTMCILVTFLLTTLINAGVGYFVVKQDVFNEEGKKPSRFTGGTGSR